MSSLPSMPVFQRIFLDELKNSTPWLFSPSFIDIDYFQPNQDTITCLPKLSAVPESNLLMIKLRMGRVTRRFFFDEESGQPRWEDEDTGQPDSEHYVPNISGNNNEVSAMKQQLSQFIEQHTSQQVMSDVMQTFWSFAREALATVDHNSVIVRQFNMVIKIVEVEYYDWSGLDLVESSEYDELVRIYEGMRSLRT